MDYTINIKTLPSGVQKTTYKFKPKSKTGDGDKKYYFDQFKETANKFVSTIAKNGGTIAGFESFNVLSNAVGKIAKVVPAVAVAYAITQVAIAITDTSQRLYASYTGNDIAQMNWNNFKTSARNAVMPFRFVSIYPQQRNRFYKVQEQRALSGNTYTGVQAGGFII